MKQVILMRHAKSSWDDQTLSDHERPLNRRGKNDAPRMGHWFQNCEYQVDSVLCSTATRTRQTLELFVSVLELKPEITFLNELYHASPGQIVHELTLLPEQFQQVLVIAHNPGMEELMCYWSGEERHCPTAAIGIYDFPDLPSWEDLSLRSKCDEVDYQIPKELNDL